MVRTLHNLEFGLDKKMEASEIKLFSDSKTALKTDEITDNTKV